jgi:hypothetical protein
VYLQWGGGAKAEVRGRIYSIYFFLIFCFIIIVVGVVGVGVGVVGQMREEKIGGRKERGDEKCKFTRKTIDTRK